MSRSPLATYRLQLGPDLTFAGAAELVGYLADLGISHLYLSPVLQARPGSTHGYDVADPTQVSAELGGEAGLRALADTAHAAGLGVVLDIVPNHLGTGFDTPMWRALLAEGPSGAAGRTFDVDFDTPLPGAAGKVVLPVLGDPYGAVLHRGELDVVEEDGELRLAYWGARFPLSEETVEALRRTGGPASLRGTPRQPATWNRLHALLERQHYRLTWWRAGLLNYRRFFSIDELAGLRVEDDAVFDATHATVLGLVRDGVVDGLRIDHPDGLRDPARYLERLAQATGGIWTVVEKITVPGEQLRAAWATAGTTGYDFCNQVLALFVDPDAEPDLDDLLAAVEDADLDPATEAWAAKLELLAGELAPDVRRLARLAWPVAAAHPEHRDVDLPDLVGALAEVLAELPVYRTYVDPRTGASTDEDAAHLDAALDAAELEDEGLEAFLRALLLGEIDDPAALDVAARFQQLSGAVMAKGAEDTMFYRYRRLAAVCEVGGEPAVLGTTVADFHGQQVERAAATPTALVTTATHDTKWGEDARLRIAALSERTAQWREVVQRVLGRDRHTTRGEAGEPQPDASTRYLLLQAMVGVLPVEGGGGDDVLGRLQAYAQKACREAKLATSWRDPDEDFEAATAGWVAAVLADRGLRRDLDALVRACAEIAATSGLAQVLLRCTVPGVPDTYQSTETWSTVLVDPDNRGPVDGAALRAGLAALDAGADPAQLWASRHDGRVKTWVLSRALRARRDHQGCVGAQGGYEPLDATGARAPHLVAFARTAPDGDALIAVAPRLPGGLAAAGGWGDAAVGLPEGRWRDVLTGAERAGGPTPLAEVMAVLPVALLARAG